MKAKIRIRGYSFAPRPIVLWASSYAVHVVVGWVDWYRWTEWMSLASDCEFIIGIRTMICHREKRRFSELSDVWVGVENPVTKNSIPGWRWVSDETGLRVQKSFSSVLGAFRWICGWLFGCLAGYYQEVVGGSRNVSHYLFTVLSCLPVRPSREWQCSVHGRWTR